MRVTLIHNPDSGDEHPDVEEFLAWIRAAGHAVTYLSSKGKEWHQALENPGDLVAVAGGDGTVGSVAARMVGRRIPLAVLPLGTANNISTTLGLADTPLERLVDGWARARRIGFGIGVVRGPCGENHFIEGMGVGLLTQAMAQLDDAALAHIDTREGRVKSALRWLRNQLGDYPAQELTIALDGENLSGDYILLEVMNIQHIGPGLHLAPDADPGDGLLEVVRFSANERDELGKYLAKRLIGNSHPPEWTVRSGRRLQLQWDGSDLHIDDKVWPSPASASLPSPIVLDVTVDRHALQFLV